MLYIPDTSVEFLPYVIHSEAIKYMMSSTVLILIIPSHKSNKSIITGKLFEYLATGKPILCLGPVDGDAAEILQRYHLGKCFSYDDVEGIENYILYKLATPPEMGKSIPIEFSRRSLAKQLASLL